MVRALSLGIIAAVVLSAAYGIITLYDESLTVGRMWETPAIRPHETPIPAMPDGVVPINGGEMLYRSAAYAKAAPPLNLNDAKVVELGKTAYTNYCIHCHGKLHDGNGTVGQSFVPPPGDLRGARVQKELTPSDLFNEVSYGLPGGRQPPLATTVSVNDRWRVIAYVKSLGLRN